MIDPTTIQRGDTFKIILRNDLWKLAEYEQRLRDTSNLGLPRGWNTTSDFLPPVREYGLALPGVTIPSELIGYLEVDAEFTVERVLFHSPNVATFGGAYQCLLVSTTINNNSQTGFIWSTYGGKEFIQPITKHQPPPDQPPPDQPVPDQPTTTSEPTTTTTDSVEDLPEESPTPVPPLPFPPTIPFPPPAPAPAPSNEPPSAPEPPQDGTEIVVYAGQTIVLELKTTGKVNDGKEDEAEKEKVGSIEVELVDTDGKPYTQAEIVHLIGEQGIYTVPINQATGKGSKSGIKAGTYDLALLLGTVYFASDEAGLSQAASQELEKVRSKLVNAGKLDFNKLKCMGYADSDGSQTYNDNLCLKRALSVKEQLSKIQEKVKYIDTGLGGMLPGSDEEVKKKNRKVEVLAAVTVNLA